jgi:hypothetical protein
MVRVGLSTIKTLCYLTVIVPCNVAPSCFNGSVYGTVLTLCGLVRRCFDLIMHGGLNLVAVDSSALNGPNFCLQGLVVQLVLERCNHLKTRELLKYALGST